MLASQRNGTLYIGSTNVSLAVRLAQHRTGRGSKFTADYGAVRLVWFEEYDELRQAQEREFRLKKWNRAWKIRLIEELNPDWNDLSLRLND